MKSQNNLKDIWQITLKISRIVFEVSLILYLVLFLIEEIKNGFVSNFFNLNYLLLICIIFGALTAFREKEEKKFPCSSLLKKSDYFLISGLSILAIILVFVKIKTIGFLWTILISILSGILIFLISWLFIKEDNDNEEKI